MDVKNGWIRVCLRRQHKSSRFRNSWTWTPVFSQFQRKNTSISLSFSNVVDWDLKVWDSLVVSLQYVFPGPATQAQACFHTTACQTHHGTAREVGWLCVIQPTSRRLGESRVQLRVSKWSKAGFYISNLYKLYHKNIYTYISKISDATLQLGKPFIEQQLFSDDIHPDIHTASNPQRHSASTWIAPLFALLNLFGNGHKITQLRREWKLNPHAINHTNANQVILRHSWILNQTNPNRNLSVFQVNFFKHPMSSSSTIVFVNQTTKHQKSSMTIQPKVPWKRRLPTTMRSVETDPGKIMGTACWPWLKKRKKHGINMGTLQNQQNMNNNNKFWLIFFRCIWFIGSFFTKTILVWEIMEHVGFEDSFWDISYWNLLDLKSGCEAPLQGGSINIYCTYVCILCIYHMYTYIYIYTYLYQSHIYSIYTSHV